MHNLLYIRTYLIFYRNDIHKSWKIHRDDLEDPRSVPFNPNAAYAMGRGIPHGRYVKISIVSHLLLLVRNTFIAGSLWAMRLWTVVVMTNGVLVPPLPRPLVTLA
jgi:hypothetical protein